MARGDISAEFRNDFSTGRRVGRVDWVGQEDEAFEDLRICALGFDCVSVFSALLSGGS